MSTPKRTSPKRTATRKAAEPASPVPPDITTLPGRVRFARELRGLATRGLGAAAGLSSNTVHKLEHSDDGSTTQVGTIEALARVLDCHPAWLAFGVGSPPKKTT